jgi:glycosyltransferase involved in cell wall biosynthesis
MKIVYLGRYNESEILTGPEKVAKRIFHNMTKINPNCVFIEYFFDGAKYNIWEKLFGKEKIADADFEIYRLGLFRIFFFLIISKPEIIHIITFERFAFVAFIFRLFFKVKIFYTVHGIAAFEKKLQATRHASIFCHIKNKIVESLIYTRSYKLIFLSKISIANAKKHFNFDENKVSIIPHAVDDLFFQNYEKKGNNNSAIKAVFVGDFSRPEKGLKKLLEVLKGINIKMELHIISDSEKVIKVSDKNIEVICHKKYDSYGYSAFLLDKDIFISASTYEQFSISALEGIASGLVPFFTIETGLSEVTSIVDCGFYFTYHEMYKIIDYLEEFQKNKKTHTDKIPGLHEILQELSWDKIVKRYYQLYCT